jgi:oligopeptide transport system substrate-binding protein
MFACSLLISFGFLGVGCQKAEPAFMQAAREDRLLVGNGVEPSTLDPHLNTGSPESVIIGALWEPLLRWNDTATSLVPAAATRWDVSEDGLVHTFHLRPESRWSNGDPVTAEQWVRSVQRLLEPGLGAEFATKAYDLVGAEDFHLGRTKDPRVIGVSAVSAHTLEFRLRAPSVAFLYSLTAYPWVPVHPPSVEAAGGLTRPGTDFTRPGKLISNGPFHLVEWRVSQFVRVEANPHFRTAPTLREIRYFAIESSDTEERAYRTGQLHVTSSVPPTKVVTYRAAGDPALRITPRVGAHYLIFNATRPPFDDARVRRALALALDRRQLVEAVLRSGEPPAYALVYPVDGGYAPVATLSESLSEAQQLLADAGFPNGRGFPPVEYLYNTNERNRDVAEAIQQMWRRNLGIQVVLRNEEWKVFLQTRLQGGYQIARAGWLQFGADPIEMYELLLSTSAFNDTRWKHAGFDELYESARRTLEPQRRYDLYRKMDVILHDEMPVVPFAYYTRARMVHPLVTNWHDNIVDARPWANVGFGATPE